MPGSNLPRLALLGLSVAATLVLTSSHCSAQALPSDAGDGSLLALGERLGIQHIDMDTSGQIAVEFADTSSVQRHQKSALLAVLFSVVPGGGQIYNGSYWKVPIVWGVQAFFVSQWIVNNREYKSYQSQYSESITPANPLGDGTLKKLRNDYLDQRDSYAWYIAGTYLISILDAYVDAELSGFDVSPNLGAITPSGGSVAVSFRMKF